MTLDSFIHYRYFYSASSSPLLLRVARDYSTDTVSKLTCRRQLSEGLAQGLYMAARVGFNLQPSGCKA